MALLCKMNGYNFIYEVHFMDIFMAMYTFILSEYTDL